MRDSKRIAGAVDYVEHFARQALERGTGRSGPLGGGTGHVFEAAALVAGTVASIRGGDGIHDTCKQAGPSDPVGLPGPGCENDVLEPSDLPPANALPMAAPPVAPMREN